MLLNEFEFAPMSEVFSPIQRHHFPASGTNLPNRLIASSNGPLQRGGYSDFA
jgi:hypothetical protein